MAAIALFRGPSHVLEWGNEEFLAFVPREGRGMPVREAFPEEQFRDTQATMDEVFLTGRTLILPRPLGVLVVAPRHADGRVRGVSTYFELAPHALAPRPPRLPQLVAVGAGHPAVAPSER